MKSVFIFGAGASRKAGGPLMSDFFDKAERLLHKGMVNEAKSDFENVFKALAELQSLHAKSAFDLNNLESVFGAIEMGKLIHKLARRTPIEIAKLREAMVILIVKTLEQSMPFPVIKGQVKAHTPYAEFAEAINIYKSPTSDRDNTFITFNYDVALEYALFNQKIPFDYCLAGSQSSSRDKYPLLKLHGSINWGVCPMCNTIQPFEVSAFSHPYFSEIRFNGDEPRTWPIDLGSKIGTQVHNDPNCRCALSPTPLIVPPTWDKTSGHAKLGNVWKRAAKELEGAENIFIIGYSLPDSDLFFRYLFSLGLEGDTRIKRLWVIDPDQANVEPRFKRLIGPGLESRFQHIPRKFEQSIGLIQRALENPDFVYNDLSDRLIRTNPIS